jgi:hypothetical protein
MIGKFRHLPVVENGEVIAILDITKCLYDAIARVEKASQQGGSIAAAAVDGVEHQRGSNNIYCLTVTSMHTIQIWYCFYMNL